MRHKLDQRGSADPLLIPLVIAVVLLLGIASFGVWSYTKYLDANKVEQGEIDEAVASANAKLTEDLELAFAEREKSPNRVYTSPQASGSVAITYPKTWSVYSEENEQKGTVEAFLHPKYVRDRDSEAPVALKVTIENEQYSNEARNFKEMALEGVVKVKAIETSGITGIRVDGQVYKDFQGALVMFPLRDKTLTIWTENNDFIKDFNDIIIANLEFSP